MNKKIILLTLCLITSICSLNALEIARWELAQPLIIEYLEKGPFANFNARKLRASKEARAAGQKDIQSSLAIVLSATIGGCMLKYLSHRAMLKQEAKKLLPAEKAETTSTTTIKSDEVKTEESTVTVDSTYPLWKS